MSNNFVYILGSVQDGGYPQTGCLKECCKDLSSKKRFISSIAIIDKLMKQCWIIDISPDITYQLKMISEFIDDFNYPSLSGLFLTHAHIGHYGGLMNFGLESMNVSNIPIYVFKRMEKFLRNNSIFNQMINNKNIVINTINDSKRINLNKRISIKGFLVPHRNELSETVGFNIKSERKSIIYLPDIDSWSEWKVDILDLIRSHDILILDGTFYDKSELKFRDIDKVPHPSILDSVELMNTLPVKERNKVFFTHLNHTNKALNQNSEEYKKIITSGYNILKDKNIFGL